MLNAKCCLLPLLQPLHAEGNLHHGLDGDGLAILDAGAEVPERQGMHGVIVEAGIQAVENADSAHAAVGANDGVEGDRAFYVIAQNIGRISGINFEVTTGAVSALLSSLCFSSAKRMIQLPVAEVRLGMFMISE